LEEKKVIVDKGKKDFFGRPIVEDVKRRKVEEKVEMKVWIRYHEGYSNAVRKPVAFAELLGRQ
jgi:chromosome transmission fidelity protein 18